MSSEEEDYMSPAFLEKCVQDVRPGLVKDHSKRREYELEAKKSKIIEQQKHKSKTSTAQHRLEQGLSNPITSENKGFALLAKMGYKQGEALGKSQTGITEPVGIVIKSDRTGLGRESALKDLARKRQEIRKRKLENKNDDSEKNLEDFRKRMRLKNEEKSTLSALYKCQKTCEKLDQDENYIEPVMKWFWPESKDDKSEEEDESDNDDEKREEEEEGEEEYEPAEKLEMLTAYLRTSHKYCHWCGVKYTDDTDLDSNCPGLEKDDH